MSRLALALGLSAALATGAVFAQSVFPQEQLSNEPYQTGVIYHGSFCAMRGDSSTEVDFTFRITRLLRDGWLEVEVGTPYPQERAFGWKSSTWQGTTIHPPTVKRFNAARLCWLEPYSEPK